MTFTCVSVQTEYQHPSHDTARGTSEASGWFDLDGTSKASLPISLVSYHQNAANDRVLHSVPQAPEMRIAFACAHLSRYRPCSWTDFRVRGMRFALAAVVGVGTLLAVAHTRPTLASVLAFASSIRLD